MRNVLQLDTSPDFKPVMNHCVRCAEVPWVNESGTTRPCAWCCNRSSPMAEAVCIAASTSPGSMNCHLACARFAQSSSEAVCLQLHSDLETIRLSLRHCTLRLLHLRQQSELVLNVVADLVSNHIGLRELAGLAPDVASAEAPLKVLKEACIEVDLLVIRTIERTHCGLRKPTAGLCRSWKT